MITEKKDTSYPARPVYLSNPETGKLSINLTQKEASLVIGVLRQLGIPVDTSIHI